MKFGQGKKNISQWTIPVENPIYFYLEKTDNEKEKKRGGEEALYPRAI